MDILFLIVALSFPTVVILYFAKRSEILDGSAEVAINDSGEFVPVKKSKGNGFSIFLFSIVVGGILGIFISKRTFSTGSKQKEEEKEEQIDYSHHFDEKKQVHSEAFFTPKELGAMMSSGSFDFCAGECTLRGFIRLPHNRIANFNGYEYFFWDMHADLSTSPEENQIEKMLERVVFNEDLSVFMYAFKDTIAYNNFALNLTKNFAEATLSSHSGNMHSYNIGNKVILSTVGYNLDMQGWCIKISKTSK